MKKIIGLLSLLVLVLASSCKKDDVTSMPDPIESAVIGHILSIGGQGTNNIGPSLAPANRFILKSALSDYPINQTINETIPGETGGSVALTGTMTGLITDTGSGTITMDMVEAFKDYGMMVEGKNYTSTGNITYKGNMTIDNVAQSASSKFNIGGSLNIAGDNYSKTTTMQLVINESIKGSSMTVSVSGTVGGKAVNYSQTMNMAQ